MKRLILIAVIAAVAVIAPVAQAQNCSQYACRVGNCPWTELVIDSGFAFPSCHAWSYVGGASLSSGSLCNSTQPYGQIVYNGGLLHVGQITQTFPTRNGATDLDNFNFQYTIESSDMQSGDTVKVYVTDTTTNITLLTDTFTADTWCNNVSHSYTNAGWKGHSLRVNFKATLADTSTVVKITGVNMWQQYQP